MSLEIIRNIVEAVRGGALSAPSRLEFEVAYQVRVAIDRIKLAIIHTERFETAGDPMRVAGMELLDALQRLEALDRRFQVRSRIATTSKNADQAARG